MAGLVEYVWVRPNYLRDALRWAGLGPDGNSHPDYYLRDTRRNRGPTEVQLVEQNLGTD